MATIKYIEKPYIKHLHYMVQTKWGATYYKTKAEAEKARAEAEEMERLA